MSWSEISCRIGDEIQLIIERKRFKRGWTPPNRKLNALPQRLMSRCTALCGNASLPTIQYHEINPSELSLLNYSYDLAGKIDWHVDPKTNHRWAQDFYADIDLYYSADGTDIKRPWELARHQYFFTLALQWKDSGDERCAETIRRVWLDWINNNPLYCGIHWSSALEPAMRTISWVWTLSILKRWKGWQENDLEVITGSLVDHATFLHDHFSYFSSPYNHIIGEATGLYLIAAVLDSHPLSGTWRKKALSVLQQYCKNQFYADGFTLEQATNYHFYTLGFLALVIDASRKLGQPIEEVEGIAHAAFKAALPLRKPDGTWPPIGDLDSARAMPVCPVNFWDFNSLMALAGELFEDPDLKRVSDSQEALILCDANAMNGGIDETAARDNRTKTFALPDSGYAISQSENDWLLFDAGPIAGGLFRDSTPSTAHGHADTLQVLYQSDGVNLLEDSGIPFYNGDEEWISYFRSPAAHNTFLIEGADYVKSEGRLAWSQELPKPEMTSESTDLHTALSGTVCWPHLNITARRNILHIPKVGLFIADWISSCQLREVTWFWQTPEFASLDESRSLVRLNDLSLRWDRKTISNVELNHAASANPRGWRYHSYGKAKKGSVVVQHGSFEGECLVLNAITRDDSPSVAVTVNQKTVALQGDSTQFGLGTSVIHNQCLWEVK